MGSFPGDSFATGLIRATPATAPESFLHPPEMTRAPESLFDEIGDEFAAEVDDWEYAVAVSVGALYPHLPNDASRFITTSAASDARSLIRHIDRLDGRSAAHMARAMFEHLINFLDVTDPETDSATRYEQHSCVTELQVSENRWFLKFLPRSRARKESKRLDSLEKKARKSTGEALTKYGKGFRTSWHASTLWQRTEHHGLTDNYLGYRILSAVIHGSSGSMEGLSRKYSGTVHRIGYDLTSAKLAFAEGIRSFHALSTAWEATTQRPEAIEIRSRTAKLLSNLDAVRTTLNKLDSEIWPASEPPQRMACAAFYPGGRVRWFEYDPQEESLTPATLLNDASDLSSVYEEFKYFDPSSFGGRPMTVIVEEALVRPTDGAKPIPAASIMIPNSLRQQLESNPDPRPLRDKRPLPKY